MFVDTHCHMYREYYNNFEDLISLAKDNKVEKIIINGCDMNTNKEVIELVNKYDIFYGAIGFHPTELEDFSFEDLKWLEENVNNPKIVAIGEIGLDYHYEDYNKHLQQEVFKKQIEIAIKNNKPIIVHSRDSIQDTYNILNSYNAKGIIHCFSGSLEMAKEFIKLGYFLGIGGILTFKNAKNITNVVQNVDLKSLVLETDAPYLTPEPYRKEKNSSVYIPVIANRIAELKNIDVEEVAKVTTKNANDLFDF